MGSLTVLGLRDSCEWKRIVDAPWRHDVYHLPAYHALAEGRGEGEARLFVYRDGELTVAVPLLLRPINWEAMVRSVGPGWMDATSVYGYPGPLSSRPDLPASFRAGFQTALTEALRDLRVVSVFSRLHPLLAQTEILAGLGECPAAGETVSLDLARTSEELWSTYRENHRRHINKNRRRGLVCVHDADFDHVDDFIDLYHETMRRVDADPAYFFDRSYFTFFRDRLPEHVHLFVALLEGTVVSGGLFTACDGIVQYHLGGTRDGYLPSSPLKSVLDTVRLWGAEAGMQVFHLGGGIGGQHDALFAFKAGFSDERHVFRVWRWVVLPEVYAELVAASTTPGDVAPAGERSPFFPAYRAPEP